MDVLGYARNQSSQSEQAETGLAHARPVSQHKFERFPGIRDFSGRQQVLHQAQQEQGQEGCFHRLVFSDFVRFQL